MPELAIRVLPSEWHAENEPVSIDHRPRRAQPVPGWVDTVWAWFDQARDGIAWWLLLMAVVSAMGFGYFPVDLHDRKQARDLQAQGEWLTATDVEVYVDYVGGKGGGYHEVDGVRVRVPGAPGPVDLENVNAAGAPIHGDVHEGWQTPAAVTGYTSPLGVRLHRDGDGTVVSAMAREDYEYWTVDNTDPEFGLSLGFGGLILAGASLALNSARLSSQVRSGRSLTPRQARFDQRRRARIAHTGRRGRR